MVDWEAVDCTEFSQLIGIRFLGADKCVEKQNRLKRAYGFLKYAPSRTS
jgi:hypothetical protein